MVYSYAMRKQIEKKIFKKWQNKSYRKQGQYCLYCSDKIKFLAFLAIVINCAAKVERKSKRI